jgi:hypothetical protein
MISFAVVCECFVIVDGIVVKMKTKRETEESCRVVSKNFSFVQSNYIVHPLCIHFYFITITMYHLGKPCPLLEIVFIEECTRHSTVKIDDISNFHKPKTFVN